MIKFTLTSSGSIGRRWGRSPPYGVEIIFFHSGVFAKVVVFLQKLNNYPLYLDKKNNETIIVAIKILDLDPLQQYYHFSPFHKSTTLALKNLFPNTPFDFLNSLYLCVSTSMALLDANSTNLFHCSVSCPVVSCTKASIKSPLLLVQISMSCFMYGFQLWLN